MKDFIPPVFKNLDDEPIEEVFLIPQQATPAHCANMARIAREYGWDPRVFPLLMATGITKEDCDIIAASICQGRRLFAEGVMRTVWPDAPRFESSMLMAYTALREPASEALAAVSPDKIRIAALEQDLRERDLHIADLEASLAQCHKTIDSVMEILPQIGQTQRAASRADENDQRLGHPAIDELRECLAKICDIKDYIEEFIYRCGNESTAEELYEHVILPARKEKVMRFGDISTRELARLLRLCLPNPSIKGFSVSHLQKVLAQR